MARELRASAFELPARWNQPKRALADVEMLLSQGPAVDLVLLPETSLTGYIAPDLTCDLRPFAEAPDGPTAKALANLARQHRTHIVGPIVVADGDRVFNTMAAFAPSGERVAFYAKRHPWYVETWATPGDAPIATFAIEGVTLAIAICFDIHFLEEESARELEEADILLFPSAWVEKEDSRPAIFEALVRRFGVSIVHANWGPGEPRIWGQGGSRIVSGHEGGGEVVAIARGNGPIRVDAALPKSLA